MARSLTPSPPCRRSTARACTVWSIGLPAPPTAIGSTSISLCCLGSIERLVRFTATGEGATPEEQKLAKRLVSPANLAHWAEAWEAMSEAKAEAQALNLDRGLLLLETWFRLQQVAREHPV